MKFVWPPITKAMHTREKKITDGLEAAERGKRELEMAEQKALTVINEAKQQATHIIEQANIHSAKLIDEAKTEAKQEGQRIVAMAQGDIQQEVMQAKETLKKQVAALAVAGAEKIIKKNLDAATQNDLLNEIATEI